MSLDFFYTVSEIWSWFVRLEWHHLHFFFCLLLLHMDIAEYLVVSFLWRIHSCLSTLMRFYTFLSRTGKTLLAKTLARLVNVPFVIADATTLTQASFLCTTRVSFHGISTFISLDVRYKIVHWLEYSLIIIWWYFCSYVEYLLFPSVHIISACFNG